MMCGWRQRTGRQGPIKGVSFASLALLVTLCGVSNPCLARPQTLSPTPTTIVFVQAAQIEASPTSLKFPEGSRIVRLDWNSKPDRQPLELTQGLYAAADPRISFDASRVMFSAKKSPSAPWQIWEMNLDGGQKQQITNCEADCMSAAYLPGGEIVYTAKNAGSDTSAFLAVAKLDGSDVRRITFGPGDWRVETVLRDGRIVASASWPLDKDQGAVRNRLLYTLRPDGTGLNALRCEHSGVAVRGEVAELEDGSIAYVKSASGSPVDGTLTEVRKGQVHERAVAVGKERLGFPEEIADGQLMVSKMQKSAADSAGKLDLYVFDLRKGAIARKIYDDPRQNSFQAVPVLAHAVPKKFWSLVTAESHSGYFIALDSYSSSGDITRSTATEIHSVRVWTLPAGRTQEESLGEAPVEKDGSFYVEVAADQPVRFELLDANGNVLRSEHGYIWSRPGEQRGCAGCHSDQAIAPENRWPMTLKRFDTPTRLTQGQNAARGAHGN